MLSLIQTQYHRTKPPSTKTIYQYKSRLQRPFSLAYPTSSSGKLDPILSLLTVPVLFGLTLLRQSSEFVQQISLFSESLLQGEQLPILERCPSPQNQPDLKAIPYGSALPAYSSPEIQIE